MTDADADREGEPEPAELWTAVREAADAAGLALVVSEVRGDETRNLFLNDAAVKMLGFAREQLLVRPAFANLAPEEREKMRERRDARLRGEPVPTRFSTVVVQQDGTRVPIDVSVGQVFVEGRSLWVSFFNDLRERREAERRMARADRLAALGTLAAGIAHELSNPLSFAMLHVEGLARELARLAPDAQRRAQADALLDDIRTGIDRASTIVRDLRTFSRFDDDVVGAVDVVAALDSAQRLAAPEIRAVGRIVREIEPVPRVCASAGRLEQVLVNLLVNAAHALPPGRAGNEVRVRVASHEGWVVLEVIDNGAGISPEHLARVFDPFFTTKPVGEGTGLGLAVCHSIVTRSGGEIAIDSEPGRGTRVTVRLRIAEPGERSRAA